MKTYILLIFLSVSSVFTVYGQRGRQQQNQVRQNTNRTPPKFDATKLAGIFYYDAKKVSKKLKLKNTDKEKTLKQNLADYNKKIKNIALLDKDNLNELETTVTSLRTQLRGNPEIQKRLRNLIKNTITPVKQKIKIEEESLNKNLKENLDDKQFKKWLKYQKNQKEKLRPKRPQARNGSRSNQGRNGQRTRF